MIRSGDPEIQEHSRIRQSVQKIGREGTSTTERVLKDGIIVCVQGVKWDSCYLRRWAATH